MLRFVVTVALLAFQTAHGAFPGDALAILADGTEVLMSTVKSGELLQTVEPYWDQGRFTDPVIGFSDNYPTIPTVFRRLTFDNFRILTVTDDHLIAGDNGTGIPARYFEIGDIVLYSTGDSLVASTTKIVNIEGIVKAGSYAPITHSGWILVDGIICSCYAPGRHIAQYVREDTIHTLLLPFRLWYMFQTHTWPYLVKRCQEALKSVHDRWY